MFYVSESRSLVGQDLPSLLYLTSYPYTFRALAFTLSSHIRSLGEKGGIQIVEHYNPCSLWSTLFQQVRALPTTHTTKKLMVFGAVSEIQIKFKRDSFYRRVRVATRVPLPTYTIIMTKY